MDEKKNKLTLQKLSNVVLEELKELAATGKQLTADALQSRLSSRTEIKELMETTVQPAAGVSDDDLETPSEVNKLHSQLETFRMQREKLLKQLTELEEESTKAEDVYKRALLVFVDLLRTNENNRIYEPLNVLKEGLKQGIDIASLDDAVKQIKDITLHDDLPQESERIGFFDRFLKRVPSDQKKQAVDEISMGRLIEAYTEIIDELKLNLDEDSLKKLMDIEDRIQQVDSPDDFLSIRKEIISLIQEYINRVSGEREAAAAFIREIGERLIEVESHVLDSFPHTRETHQANTEFHALLEQQIGELRESVDFSKTLTELKQTVTSSLTTIQSAIEDKRKKDKARTAAVDKRMEGLQQDLQAMKKEISTAKERAHALELEVLIDPLTEVYNRRAYEKRLNEELQRYLRYQRAFSILLLDVDHFKSVNDQYGHAVGDLCLKEIIKRVRPLLRESDFLARFGGEEFVSLLPETDRQGAIGVAEKLRKCIENTEFLHRGEAVAITISVGVTQVESADMRPETLFNRVDQAMYRAKEKGRNCVIGA